MRGLTFIEFMALVFTGVAGIASAIQAYVSYETRGEVARAIVFAERISACAGMMAAIEPFRHKASPEGRAKVEAGSGDGRYSITGLYYGQFVGSPAVEQLHGPRVQAWRDAYARVSIVLPDEVRERAEVFDQAIARDFYDQALGSMAQGELVAWLERFDREAEALAEECRGLVV